MHVLNQFIHGNDRASTNSVVKLYDKIRCGTHVVNVDGALFDYVGTQSGVVKILEPMNSIHNYFEFEIKSAGAHCSMGIGVGDIDYPLGAMPGWEKYGVGYHADDGHLYYQHGYGKPFGSKCKTGDVMGCGVIFNQDSENVEIFFTKNGEQVGHLVSFKKPQSGLYAIIAMGSVNERIQYLGHRHREPRKDSSLMIVSTCNQVFVIIISYFCLPSMTSRVY